jgi:hypothetical protein
MELIELGEIAKALAAAQLEMSNPVFDSQNPHFRSRFASLASVRNAIVPVLARHGICVTQDLGTTSDGKGIACTTYLTHESGQQMTFGPLVIPATKPDAMGYGSAATYARRYSLQAVACVAADEDDDSNAAVGKPAAPVAIGTGKGIGVHSPLGDLNPDVADLATQYADALRLALNAEDGDVIAVVRDMEAEVDEHGQLWGEELKRPVWAQLDSKTRSAIKKLLAEAA